MSLSAPPPVQLKHISKFQQKQEMSNQFDQQKKSEVSCVDLFGMPASWATNDIGQDGHLDKETKLPYLKFWQKRQEEHQKQKDAEKDLKREEQRKADVRTFCKFLDQHNSHLIDPHAFLDLVGKLDLELDDDGNLCSREGSATPSGPITQNCDDLIIMCVQARRELALRNTPRGEPLRDAYDGWADGYGSFGWGNYFPTPNEERWVKGLELSTYLDQSMGCKMVGDRADVMQVPVEESAFDGPWIEHR